MSPFYCVYIPTNSPTSATLKVSGSFLEQQVNEPYILNKLCGYFIVNFLSKGKKQACLSQLTKTFDLKLVNENLITRETKSQLLIKTCFLRFIHRIEPRKNKNNRITDQYCLS